MQNSHSPLPLDAPYYVVGIERTPACILNWFKPKLSLALREDSFPLLVMGGGGSGRSRALQSMLIQNIREKSPFIFVRGFGDSHYLEGLLKQVTENECVGDLRNINFDLSHAGRKHTFDPINPLVGDLQAFQALFGSVGPLLHQLCLAEHQEGQLVDLSLFKSYLDLENLQRLRDQAKYEPAQEALDHYLISVLEICYQDGHSQKQAAMHEKFMSKPLMYYQALVNSQLCSTEPDVDFKNVFKSGKYVCITLPMQVKDAESHALLSTLFIYLISQSATQCNQVSANPEVIFDGVYEYRGALALPLDRLSDVNTVFTLQSTSTTDCPDDSFVAQICNAARSVLNMKTESCCHLDRLKVSAFNHGVSATNLPITAVQGQSPGDCFAWGNLAVIRKGKPFSLIGLAKARVRYNGKDSM